MIEIDISKTRLKNKDLTAKPIMKLVRKAHDNLHALDRSNGTGWVDLPSITSKTEMLNIKKLAKEIQDKCDVFLVIGIGGSYLGAYSAIKMLKRNPKTEIRFIGLDFNAYELMKTLEDLKQKEVCVNVISKSGTTTETLIAFELIESYMKKRYKKKDEYKSRIIVTTDYEKGYLREVCTLEGYQSLVLPRNVGGRYSVLTPVGLLPMSVAGINIEKIMAGAKSAYDYCFEYNALENPAYKYAITRYLLNKKAKKQMEITATFDDRLGAFLSWHQQLFAESEGKDQKGLYVSPVRYSTDLHSVGQFIQQGTPLMFETMFEVKVPEEDMKLENITATSPISYLEGKLLSEVNKSAMNGVVDAHASGKTPVVQIKVDALNDETFGELVFMFEVSCAVSAYMLGVNPFDQPGVEAYKKRMREKLS